MNVARISRVLTAAVIVAGLTAALVPLANDLFNRHVLSVRVAGKFKHVSRAEFESVVRNQLTTTGFFAIDVESVRSAALSLPWVRDVTVRRVWPDSVHIAVAERVAVARWNEGLMEDDATIFTPRERVTDDALPRLAGPQGQHAQVLDLYKRLSDGLGSLAGGVVALNLSERGQWEVGFGNGMTIVPSTKFDVVALMQFSRTLPSILGDAVNRVARIDLRYANGFAVRWREEVKEVAESSVGARPGTASAATDERPDRARGSKG